MSRPPTRVTRCGVATVTSGRVTSSGSCSAGSTYERLILGSDRPGAVDPGAQIVRHRPGHGRVLGQDHASTSSAATEVGAYRSVGAEENTARG